MRTAHQMLQQLAWRQDGRPPIGVIIPWIPILHDVWAKAPEVAWARWEKK